MRRFNQITLIYHLLALFAGGLILGCKKEVVSSEVKFAVLAKSEESKANRFYLITKVHEPIKYSIEVVNGDCVDQAIFKKQIEKALQEWLAILREMHTAGNLPTLNDQAITSQTTFVDSPAEAAPIEPTKDYHQLGLTFTSDPEIPQDYHVKLYLVCHDKGRPYEKNKKHYSQVVLWADKLIANERYRNFADEDIFFMGDTAFSYRFLKHELGHSFGLADTYVEQFWKQEGKLNKTTSTDGYLGSQPSSVMNDASEFTADDKIGLKWLYDFVVMDKASVGDSICPTGFAAQLGQGRCISIDTCNKTAGYAFFSSLNTCLENCPAGEVHNPDPNHVNDCICDVENGYAFDIITGQCIKKVDCDQSIDKRLDELGTTCSCAKDKGFVRAIDNVCMNEIHCRRLKTRGKAITTTCIKESECLAEAGTAIENDGEPDLFSCICDWKNDFQYNRTLGQCRLDP